MQDRPLPFLSLLSQAEGRRENLDFVSALAAYEEASALEVESWFDIDRYAEFSKLGDAVREDGVAVPELTALTLQLHIAHAELVSTLWQNVAVGVPPVHMEQVRARHAVAIEGLRAAATQVLAGR